MTSTHHKRPAGVAERFQIPEHLVRCCSPEARDVLSEHPAGSDLSHQACELGPQVTFVLSPFPLPRDGVGLAGEPADDGIDSSAAGQNVICSKLTNVRPPGDGRPVLRQHGQAEGLQLDLARDGPACPGQPQVERADSRKETEEAHSRRPHSCGGGLAGGPGYAGSAARTAAESQQLMTELLPVLAHLPEAVLLGLVYPSRLAALPGHPLVFLDPSARDAAAHPLPVCVPQRLLGVDDPAGPLAQPWSS